MRNDMLCAIAAAAAMLGSQAHAEAVTHPAIAAFANLPLAAGPQLSPDGAHFAAIQPVDGRPAAMIYTLGAPAGTFPKVVASPSYVIRSVKWVKNDRLMILAEADSKILDRAQVTYGAISVDVNGEHPAKMFSNTPLRDIIVVDLDLDDPTHILMPGLIPVWPYTVSNQLFRVDVTTGAVQTVMNGTPRTTQWITDGKGEVAGRVETTAKLWTDHLEVPVKDGWKEIGAYDAKGGGNSGIAGLSLDGAAFALYAPDDKSGMGGLSAIDRASAKQTALYFNPSHDVDAALADPWTARVIGAAFADDRMEYTYFDPAMEALQHGLEAAFPGRSAHAVSWDLAKDRLIVAVDGARQPLSYYYLDRTTHQATKIAAAYPDLHEADLGEKTPYAYKARDGLDIPAYLTLPPGKAARNLPAVILPHGGPEQRDDLGFDWMAAFFANRGYAVLQPNFRGSAGYGAKFREAGYGQWGLKMQDDVSDGVKALVASGIADPKRICIVGASYGGYAALAGAAYTPDLYACAVSWAGVSDLRLFLRTRAADYGRYSWMVSTWTRYIGDGRDDAEKLDAASPALHAGSIKCPVLLMHGAGDTTVRIDQSEEMRDALQRAGKNVTFVKIDADTHYMLFADTRLRFLTETEAFLKKNIGD